MADTSQVPVHVEHAKTINMMMMTLYAKIATLSVQLVHQTAQTQLLMIALVLMLLMAPLV